VTTLDVSFQGVGLWARGMTSYPEFAQALQEDFANLDGAEFMPPKPEAIAPRERRRAGLTINIAVEVAHQACQQAQVDISAVPSVFVSAMGDTAITDYMCRKLAQPQKMLSPTKFHNSVHNAPSGYWTISAENRAPSSFVGGFTHSFGSGLFEAASQAVALQMPVLAVFYDIANEPPFTELLPIAETLAIALVVAPQDEKKQDEKTTQPLVALDASLSFVERQPGEIESMPKSERLTQFAQSNPMGPALALVEQFSAAQRGGLRSPSLRFGAAPKAWLDIQH
jgi:hypothetical protein